MPKALCIAAMVISILVFILFLSDLLLGFASMDNLAPFKGANPVIDIVFVVCAAVLGYLSWSTFREQI